MYVGDRENNRVQVFDADGRFLEQWKESGAPFEGMRENADFWRWLISYYVRNGRERDDWWRPPNPAPPPPAAPAEGQKKPADAFELEGK